MIYRALMRGYPFCVPSVLHISDDHLPRDQGILRQSDYFLVLHIDWPMLGQNFISVWKSVRRGFKCIGAAVSLSFIFCMLRGS